MSVNSSVYSGKEFSVYISHDDTTSGVGTFNSNTSSQWNAVDIDSFSFPSFNPTQEFEMRTGSGRIAPFDSVFVSEKGVVREVTLAGRLTDEVLKIFGENVLGEVSSSGDIACAYNHAPATLTDEGTVAEGNYSSALSVYFKSPVSGKSWKLKGAVCTSFNISADMGTAGGRFNFSATLQTGYAPTSGDISSFTAPSISSTKIFLSDMTTKSLTDNTSGFAEIDPLISTFGLTMAGSAQMLGMQGSAGEPEVIARLVPELEITYEMALKYASDTAPLIEEYKSTDQDIAIALSGTGFGVDIAKSKLTQAELDSGDIAKLNLAGKMLAPSSGDAFTLTVSDS